MRDDVLDTDLYSGGAGRGYRRGRGGPCLLGTPLGRAGTSRTPATATVRAPDAPAGGPGARTAAGGGTWVAGKESPPRGSGSSRPERPRCGGCMARKAG